MDISHIRAQFLQLQQQGLVYLDTASSAQKPEAVLLAVHHAQTEGYANIHRGLYGLSATATARYEAARETVANFIGAKPNEIIFTRNATEGINLFAQTWGKNNLKVGQNIVLTHLEHHANIVPWQILAEEKGVETRVADLNNDLAVTPENLLAKIDDQTACVAFSALSNAIGSVTDVAVCVQAIRAKAPNAKILIDATQAVVHGKVDVAAWDADAVVFTGHKLYAPTGIGVLWLKEDVARDLPPYQSGGDMIETVSFNTGTIFAQAPQKFEAGTPNFVGAIGLAAAIDWLEGLGWQNIQRHETKLREILWDGLIELGCAMLGTRECAAVVSFNIPGTHHSDVATLLAEQNICVRVGHHCCMPLMEHLGIQGTVRASVGVYNIEDDIHTFLTAVGKIKKLLT